MANPVWPTSLPVPLQQGAQYEPLIENVITSSVETGAPKRRRRFTAVPDKFTGQLILTATQVATLNTFVVTTLKDVLPFDWKDFRTGSACSYVFSKRPVYARVPDSRLLWTASLELQVKL